MSLKNMECFIFILFCLSAFINGIQCSTPKTPDAELVENVKSAIHNDDLVKLNQIFDGGADVNGKYNGLTPIMWAVELFAGEEIAKALIEKGANINAETDLGNTALSFAATKGRTSAFNFLIENGADVNHVDKEGKTPLVDAIIKNKEDTSGALIQKGANVNHIINSRKLTPLLLAAELDEPNIVQLLVENGAYVNHTDVDGNTALHIAISVSGYHAHDVVGLLLEHGADRNIKNKNSKLPLDLLEGKEEYMQEQIREKFNQH